MADQLGDSIPSLIDPRVVLEQDVVGSHVVTGPETDLCVPPAVARVPG